MALPGEEGQRIPGEECAVHLVIFLALLAVVLAGICVAVYWHDTRQTEHTILRNYPVIGHFRYFAETWGEYMRQYHYLPDWAERPFNRLDRSLSLIHISEPTRPY